MKSALIVLALALALTTLPAAARKSCDELKQEIASKLDTKGVQNYVLAVVAKDSDDARKAVGSCDGGTQKIVYERTISTKALARN